MALKESLQKFAVETSLYCPFQRVINKLSPEDKATLSQALVEGYPNITIAKALRTEGHRIAEISIMEHRKGLCRCPKTQNSKKS
jgi:hypothetical protein